MKAANHEMPIEVEAQSFDQVDDAIQSGADIILLDNLTTDQINDALTRVAGRAKVEVSGGVTLERIPELAATGADYVSVGALTHSAPAADLSFELEPDA
jgi:nicotinate-nucleotide pyrophosphorylase (carboxylating)